MRRVRIIGPGRAGGSLAGALRRCGWAGEPLLGRDDDCTSAADGIDLLVVATPDAAIADVAATVAPSRGTVVAHLSGALGLDVLSPHHRRAGLHPLVSLADAECGADLLADGAWFAVAGDPLVGEVVEALGGRSVTVDDTDRTAYHAAAVVASNHLVALLGQVERLAGPLGVPLEAFLDLADGSLANVRALGPADALTGPAARGDEATIQRHLAALAADERPGYEAVAELARRLADENPDWVFLYQYANEANPRAHYTTTGPEILRDVPDITHFVAGLGTSGTLMGVGTYLKERRPEVQVLAVEPPSGELVQGLRSLDDGYIPPVYEKWGGNELLDGKRIVRPRESLECTRRLADECGIFAGISTGAALAGALKVAERLADGEEATIVFIACDAGWKYLSTGAWTDDLDTAAANADSIIYF